MQTDAESKRTQRHNEWFVPNKGDLAEVLGQVHWFLLSEKDKGLTFKKDDYVLKTYGGDSREFNKINYSEINERTTYGFGYPSDVLMELKDPANNNRRYVIHQIEGDLNIGTVDTKNKAHQANLDDAGVFSDLTKILQIASGVTVDGAYGVKTTNAVARMIGDAPLVVFPKTALNTVEYFFANVPKDKRQAVLQTLFYDDTKKSGGKVELDENNRAISFVRSDGTKYPSKLVHWALYRQTVEYQKAHHLSMDGLIGKETLKALLIAPQKQLKTPEN
jgi:peptidoglycan hydrolase-like protein with peptidoglycan-binding domain